MLKKTRKAFTLVPACQQLDVRLAPSGNFLAHGFTEIADAVKHTGHHRAAEHGTMGGATDGGGMKVHYHHHHAK